MEQHEFVFDVKMFATVHVMASNEDKARILLSGIQEEDLSHKCGRCIIRAVSVDDCSPVLTEVDGSGLEGNDEGMEDM